MTINEKVLEAKDLEKVSGGINDFSNNHGAEVKNPVVGNRYIVYDKNDKRWFKATFNGLIKYAGPNWYAFSQLELSSGNTFSACKLLASMTTIYEQNS